jgi:hypothetical protein
VFTSFPNLTNYVQYTKKIADIFATLNKPIMWITPVGMIVKMGYKKEKVNLLKVFFLNLDWVLFHYL